MDKKRKFKHLTFTDRLTIERMNNAKMTAKEIAIAVGCSERTIYYELKRGRSWSVWRRPAEIGRAHV